MSIEILVNGVHDVTYTNSKSVRILEDGCGTKRYYKQTGAGDYQRHREGAPAVQYRDGYKEFWLNGVKQ